METKSKLTLVGLFIGGTVLIVAIFKFMPHILNFQEDTPQAIVVEETSIQIAPANTDKIADIQLLQDALVQEEAQATDLSQQSPTTSQVTELKTAQDVTLLTQADTPCVVKFYAPWCGACQYVNAFYQELADSFAGKVQFFSVDVGTKDVMQALQAANLTQGPIEYLPTFVYYLNQQPVKQLTGARDLEGLKNEVKEHLKL